jgi:hypothetical protein
METYALRKIVDEIVDMEEKSREEKEMLEMALRLQKAVDKLVDKFMTQGEPNTIIGTLKRYGEQVVEWAMKHPKTAAAVIAAAGIAAAELYRVAQRYFKGQALPWEDPQTIEFKIMDFMNSIFGGPGMARPPQAPQGPIGLMPPSGPMPPSPPFEGSQPIPFSGEPTVNAPIVPAEEPGLLSKAWNWVTGLFDMDGFATDNGFVYDEEGNQLVHDDRPVVWYHDPNYGPRFGVIAEDGNVYDIIDDDEMGGSELDMGASTYDIGVTPSGQVVEFSEVATDIAEEAAGAYDSEEDPVYDI